jgi:hypothetical protein
VEEGVLVEAQVGVAAVQAVDQALAQGQAVAAGVELALVRLQE